MPTPLNGCTCKGRGQGRALVSPRIRSPSSRNPDRINVQTLPRRTNTRNPVSHTGGGQAGRELRRPDGRGTVLQNHQLASRVSHVAASPVISRDHTSQHRFMGVRLDLALRKVIAQALSGIGSRQTTHERSAHADGLASTASRPRWFTPCSTKLLSVTYSASARALRSAPSACVRHQSPPGNAQVCVLPLAGRAITAELPVTKLRIPCQRISQGTVHPGGRTLSAGSSARAATCYADPHLALRSSENACASGCLHRCHRAHTVARAFWLQDTCASGSIVLPREPTARKPAPAHSAVGWWARALPRLHAARRSTGKAFLAFMPASTMRPSCMHHMKDRARGLSTAFFSKLQRLRRKGL